MRKVGASPRPRGLLERVRLDAVARFEAGQTTRAIATVLRVSERSVERWRRQWHEGGALGVASKGSPGRSRLLTAKLPD
ncbi:helix-turn-helix domain-containing protein [Streptomyces sp. NPDC057460]|uniref:helix-turn-helix domain-containing protein n=1 Tax=Streptomyces sp. NPDC057460 TaxID=3346141 RepID=UPI003677DD6C